MTHARGGAAQLSHSIRPMQPGDLPAALDVMDHAMDAVFRRNGRAVHTHTEHERVRALHALTRTLAENAPGCFVALDGEGALIGMAMSTLRAQRWGLALLFVAPHAQGYGIGTLLLKRAAKYGHGCPHRVIVSSEDPGALRLYLGFGLNAHPALRASGKPTLGRHNLPTQFREGDTADLVTIDAIDKATTLASRADDVRYLLNNGARLLMATRGHAHGYAVVRDGSGLVAGHPVLIGADNADIAKDLLVTALALTKRPVDLYGLTAHHGWAIDACDVAGLALEPGPTLCLTPGTNVPPTSLMHGLYF